MTLREKNRPVIADTGPLLALFDQGDAFHTWARDGLGRIGEPLLTSEAILSEVFFLLSPMRRSRPALASNLQFFASLPALA